MEFEHEEPLYGTRSVESLARRIARTMPDNEPAACVGVEAEQVAAWIHGAFYSLEARERLGLSDPVRVELSRLTVAQHGNVIADLLLQMGSPSGDGGPVEVGGLRGRYYSSEGMNIKKALGLERVDGHLAFDFGDGAPVPSIDPEQFSITWEGSFHAGETGAYRFRTRTPNGVRLYVNADSAQIGNAGRQDSGGGSRLPLIDDWVSSGNRVRETEAGVRLLGGRRYPIRLDFFKYKEARGSIELEWKPPHGVWSVLPASILSPEPAPRIFFCSAPFPPDDRSFGYERGRAVSKAWQRATLEAAFQVAAEVIDRLDTLSGVGGNHPERARRLQAFCHQVAETAFRRPLDDAQRTGYVDRWFAEGVNPETAVRRSIWLCLSSPHFLYCGLPGSASEPDGWTIASRLSFALWDSLPDRRLLDAARSGQLTDPQEIRRQAERMIDHPRTRAKLRKFFTHWLELEDRDPAKDRALFPEFTDGIIADLRESLYRFVDQIVWSEGSDYRELLLADYLLLNDGLAALYEGEPRGGSGAFRRYAVQPRHRAGVLTHPYLLSVLAYHNNTSPIHRGVFLTRNIVGRPLKPPPVAVAFKNDEFDPTLTMREKVTHLTRDSACMSCHAVINPLGFSLENFDAVGRWRQTEQDRPIEAGSEYTTLDGETLHLSGARDVARIAVASDAAHRAFVNALFHHTVKQAAAAYDRDLLDRLREQFVAHQYSIRAILLDIVQAQAVQGLDLSPLRREDP